MSETLPYPCFEFTHALHAQLSTSKEPDKVIQEYVEYILKSIQPPTPNDLGTHSVMVGLRIKERFFTEDTKVDEHPVMRQYRTMVDQLLLRLPGVLRKHGTSTDEDRLEVRKAAQDQMSNALQGTGPYQSCFLPYAEGVTIILSAASFKDELPMMMGVALYNGTYIPGKYMQHAPVYSFVTNSHVAPVVEQDTGGH